MSQRITEEMLEAQVRTINTLRNSTHYKLDMAYNGYRLIYTKNGCSAVSNNGFETKRGLHNFMSAFISGLYTAKDNQD